jgi:hypothetical protein
MAMNVDMERLHDTDRKSEICPCEPPGLNVVNPYIVVKKIKAEQTKDAIDHIIYLK